MKRDDDLIRELLFRYEAEEDWLHLTPGDTDGASEEERREYGHLLLMGDEGLVADVGSGTFRITSAGHDFIGAVRSDTVWKKTKDGASAVGGVTLGILGEIAKSYLKQEVSNKLGIAV